MGRVLLWFYLDRSRCIKMPYPLNIINQSSNQSCVCTIKDKVPVPVPLRATTAIPEAYTIRRSQLGTVRRSLMPWYASRRQHTTTICIQPKIGGRSSSSRPRPRKVGSTHYTQRSDDHFQFPTFQDGDKGSFSEISGRFQIMQQHLSLLWASFRVS